MCKRGGMEYTPQRMKVVGDVPNGPRAKSKSFEFINCFISLCTLFSRRRTLLILPASLKAAYRLACALKVPLRRALSLPDPGGSCQP
ncbi:hypothetical protein JTE90_012014 [Oedothorax gibbosus]|uniref:Uncharacterized protein n=1 Tax=Oedothorax gibbosus TaxID=931172 RepID=A0AAV6U024_9ARAC|nr:hypothetical protein JTE90_012014 [Oedothorax gibbosus]